MVPPVESYNDNVSFPWSNVPPVIDVPPPPVCKTLQEAFVSSYPSTPDIVDVVQALINVIPSDELLLTVVPKLDITTVGPPGPVAPVALFHNVS